MDKTFFLYALLFGLCLWASVPAASADYSKAANFKLASTFASWMKTNTRSYASEELLYRWDVWRSNMAYIEEHNAKNKSYTLAMNQYGDLTNEEINRYFFGLRRDFAPVRTAASHRGSLMMTAHLAPAVDWTEKGVITPVKDQGQCGSCWAFSATGAMEGAVALATGKLVSMSEQQLVDCSRSYGNYGCNGGWMDSAFEYTIKAGGIETESSYPYHAKDETCKFNKSRIAASISGFSDVPAYSEDALTKALNDGPVSVAIDAGQSSFHFYSSGVYYEPLCSSSRLNHGVLAVGYGTQDGKDYYKVKNSWGAGWGNKGYILMSRNRNNNCGIATAASYPKA